MQKFELPAWVLSKQMLLLGVFVLLEVLAKTMPNSNLFGSNFLVRTTLLISLLVLPGFAAIKALKLKFSSWHTTTLFAMAASLIFIMVLGALLCWFLPMLGIRNGLDYFWVGSVLVGLQIWLIRFNHLKAEAPTPVKKSQSKKTEKTLTRLNQVTRPRVFVSLVFSVFPILSFVAESALNTSAITLYAKIAAISSMVVTLALIALPKRWSFHIDYPVAIFFIALAFFWLASQRGFSVSGFDVQSEFGVAQESIRTSSWHVPQDGDAYSSMLSLTVLPTSIHTITGFDALTIYKGIFPAIDALIVVVAFLTLNTFVRKTIALAIVAAVVLPNPFFFIGLPALARQGVGLFFLSLILLLMFQPWVSTWQKRMILVFLAAGIAVSHYTTSYLFSALLIIGYLVLQLIDGVRRLRGIARPKRTFAYFVVIVTASLSWVWNGFITKSTSEVTKLLDFVGKYGVKALPNQNEGPSNFFETWISGSVTHAAISAKAITSQAISDRKTIYKWMLTTPGTDGFIPSHLNYVKPTKDLLVAASQQTSIIMGQITLLTEVLAVVTVFALLVFGKSRAEKYARKIEIISLGVAALVVAAILRVSGTLSLFLDPNRAALILNLIFCIVVAISIKQWRWHAVSKYLFGSIFTVVLAFNFGVISLFTNYNPSYWGSVGGIDQITKVATLQDVEAAKWMAKEIRGGIQLVSADLYGGNEISQTDGQAKFQVFPNVLPQLVDWRGYLFQAEHNTTPGITISGLNGTRYWFDFPREYLTRYRLTVYASELARVYR